MIILYLIMYQIRQIRCIICEKTVSDRIFSLFFQQSTPKKLQKSPIKFKTSKIRMRNLKSEDLPTGMSCKDLSYFYLN